MDMDLTPKKWRPKKEEKRKRTITPMVLKNWRHPLQISLIGLGVLSFLGSTGVNRIRQRGIYAEQTARAEGLNLEVAELLEQAMSAYTTLQAKGDAIILQDVPEEVRILEQRIDELNQKLGKKFAQVNECYAAMSFRYRAKPHVLEWYIDFTTRCLESALARKEFEQARLWFNDSHVKTELTTIRPRVVGEGNLEISAGADVYKVGIWPLKSDGPRIVLDDPVGGSQDFPYTLPMLETGSYLIWVTRADGVFAPYPVTIGHDETRQVTLEVPGQIPEGMVFVPGGEFICGGEASNRYREHTRALPSFFIGIHEVTFAEYIEFWKSLNDPQAKARMMSRVRFSADDENGIEAWDADGDLVDKRLNPEYPVVGISAEAAVAFCEWKSSQVGAVIRLPTAFEWEKAARGVDGRTYPWGYGFELDANLAMTLENPKAKAAYPLWAPVGKFRNDVSVYSALDMGGNVREFAAAENGGFEIRGGSTATPATFMNCSHVSEEPAAFSDIGFRYIREL